MPQATITVVQKLPPKVGAKTFDLLDDQGAKWKIWNDIGGNVQEGASYLAQYEDREFNNFQYKQIMSIKPAQVLGQGNHPGVLAATPVPHTSRPAQGKQHPDMMDLIMAVNIALKEGIRAGQINCTVSTDIINMIVSVRIAYMEGWRAPITSKAATPPSPQIDPEMDDAIGF